MPILWREGASHCGRAGSFPCGNAGRDAFIPWVSEDVAGYSQYRRYRRRHVRQHSYCTLWCEYESVIANKANQPRTKVVTLVGKHCESGDAVAADASIQNPDLGDIVCMFGTGCVLSFHEQSL